MSPFLEKTPKAQRKTFPSQDWLAGGQDHVKIQICLILSVMLYIVTMAAALAENHTSEWLKVDRADRELREWKRQFRSLTVRSLPAIKLEGHVTPLYLTK